jgi:hypothetical protein
MSQIYLVKDASFRAFVITEYPCSGDLILAKATRNEPEKIKQALDEELEKRHGLEVVQCTSGAFGAKYPEHFGTLKL